MRTLRGTFGHTFVKDLNKLPVPQQFFTGGAASIRGFAYKDIGPGRTLIIGSVEYQHRIYGNWSGAIFYDTGTARNNFDTNIFSNFFNEFSAGAGVGVIYRSPIGPIGISVARSVQNGDEKPRFQITVGPEI